MGNPTGLTCGTNANMDYGKRISRRGLESNEKFQTGIVMSRITKVGIDHVKDLWKSDSRIGGKTRRERRLRSLLGQTVVVSDPFFEP